MEMEKHTLTWQNLKLLRFFWLAAMAVALKPLLPIVLLSSLLLYEDWVSSPSCEPDPAHPKAHPDDLKVMMVADLLLLGSRSAFFHLLFRDHYLSKFFTRSYRSLRPDMLLVLGDVSARGHHSPRSEFGSVIRQFHRALGPFLDLPLHVAVGDRDVGACGGGGGGGRSEEEAVGWISRRLPGLDSAGCGAFEIGNVSFVSLNAVALLCGNSELRFSVEKAVERERVDFRVENERVREGEKERVYDFPWRENAMSAGTGPVVLLHFPLSRNVTTPSSGGSPNVFDGREDVGRGPYDLSQKLPPNATEYIFQALKPRIVFSAHTHEFDDHFHPDGTREVTVPAMTWNARDDPGFVIAIFRKNGGAVSISYCSLARESHILVAYTSLLILSVSMLAFSSTPSLRSFKTMIT